MDIDIRMNQLEAKFEQLIAKLMTKVEHLNYSAVPPPPSPPAAVPPTQVLAACSFCNGEIDKSVKFTQCNNSICGKIFHYDCASKCGICHRGVLEIVEEEAMDIEVCQICKRVDPLIGQNEEEVTWVQCDLCGVWDHSLCAYEGRARYEEAEADDTPYLCMKCIPQKKID